MVDRHLRLKEVEAATGLKHSTIYELMAAGKFPKPIPVSARARRWIESEVAEYLAGCRAKRDAEAKAA